MREFVNDADMLGTSLSGYAKNVVAEVVGIGRAGSLIEWEDTVEQRAYAVFYSAEQIPSQRQENLRDSPLKSQKYSVVPQQLTNTANIVWSFFIFRIPIILEASLCPAAASVPPYDRQA